MVGIPRLLRRLPHDVLRLRRRRTAPGKPPTGYVDVYADATGALAGVDDAGAALSIGGGGTAPRIAFQESFSSNGDLLVNEIVLDPALALAGAVGTWTLNGNNDLLVPQGGAYRYMLYWQIDADPTDPVQVTIQINSITAWLASRTFTLNVAANTDRQCGTLWDIVYSFDDSPDAHRALGKLQYQHFVAATDSIPMLFLVEIEYVGPA